MSLNSWDLCHRSRQQGDADGDRGTRGSVSSHWSRLTAAHEDAMNSYELLRQHSTL